MQVSWIDADDVRALAESLRAPVPLPTPEAPAWEGFLNEDPAESETATSDAQAALTEEEPWIEIRAPDLAVFRRQLQSLRERAIDAGVLKTTTVSSTPAPAPASACAPASEAEAEVVFEVPLGTFRERLEAFVHWSLPRLPGRTLLVLSAQGDLLWGPATPMHLLLEARVAQARGAFNAGYAHALLPTATRHGTLTVVVLGEPPLPSQKGLLLQQALTAAIDTE